MISSLAPRSDYTALEESAYFNQASLGLIGQPAVEAMHAFLDDVARHGNRFMSDDDEVAYFGSLRDRAARLLGTEADRIAIIAAASELLGQLPYLLAPAHGSTVVAVSGDFPAVTRPWLRLAATGGCELCFVDDTPERDLTDALIDSIDDRVSVLAVSHVQYATGTVVDVPRLRQATRDVDAKMIIDASQSAGAIAVDATAWGAEAVVSSGYKWLGGHGGVAVAAVAPDLLEEVPPLPGWMGAPQPFDFEATRLLVAADARRFTPSTMSYVSITGLTTALGQILSLEMAHIESHSAALSALLVDELAGSGWRPFRGLDDPAASSHIVSIAHPTRSTEATIAALQERGIVCGTRGGRIRVSLAPYNDENDVKALVEAVAST